MYTLDLRIAMTRNSTDDHDRKESTANSTMNRRTVLAGAAATAGVGASPRVSAEKQGFEPAEYDIQPFRQFNTKYSMANISDQHHTLEHRLGEDVAKLNVHWWEESDPVIGLETIESETPEYRASCKIGVDDLAGLSDALRDLARGDREEAWSVDGRGEYRSGSEAIGAGILADDPRPESTLILIPRATGRIETSISIEHGDASGRVSAWVDPDVALEAGRYLRAMFEA